ncbi:hypothetical protein C0993_002570, partial [Termitomyces sp. T159_Od127]
MRSYKPGDRPKVLFNVQGMNIARAKKLDDGGYDLLSREVQLYLDPTTNKVLNVWHNPYSGQNVTGPSPSVKHSQFSLFDRYSVVHVANNPVYQGFPASGQYEARYQPGGTYSFQFNIPLAYPNPLNPTGDYTSPLYSYSGPTQASYSAIESFTFTFPLEELRSACDSAPSTQ